jgi:hypothetical protein
MSIAMDQLGIVQHWDMLCYATIQGGGYWPWFYRFELWDYVYLQKTTTTMLDVIMRCVIFLCAEGVTLGVLLLEGQDDDSLLNPTDWSFHLRTKLFTFGKFTWIFFYIAIWLKRTLIQDEGVICMWCTI